jgi:hypothetical protein
VRVTIICGRHDTLLNTHTRLLTLCEGIHTANAGLEPLARKDGGYARIM